MISAISAACKAATEYHRAGSDRRYLIKELEWDWNGDEGPLRRVGDASLAVAPVASSSRSSIRDPSSVSLSRTNVFVLSVGVSIYNFVCLRRL